MKVKSQKSNKDNYVVSCPKVCTICTCVLNCYRIRRDIYTICFYCSELHCSRAEWILLPCLFLSDKLGCVTFQAHTGRAWKLVINKTFAHNPSLFLQLWPTLFQDWVYLTPVLFQSCSPGCALFEAYTFWARLLIFKETFVQTVFAVVNCAVVGLSVFYSLVLMCSLTFLQLWLLGHKVECILHLHFKFYRW